MAAETAKRRLLNFNIDPERLARLDDYRFRRRFTSRKDALMFLLDYALDADPPKPADPPAQG